MNKPNAKLVSELNDMGAYVEYSNITSAYWVTFQDIENQVFRGDAELEQLVIRARAVGIHPALAGA